MGGAGPLARYPLRFPSAVARLAGWLVRCLLSVDDEDDACPPRYKLVRAKRYSRRVSRRDERRDEGEVVTSGRGSPRGYGESGEGCRERTERKSDRTFFTIQRIYLRALFAHVIPATYKAFLPLSAVKIQREN